MWRIISGLCGALPLGEGMGAAMLSEGRGVAPSIPTEASVGGGGETRVGVEVEVALEGGPPISECTISTARSISSCVRASMCRWRGRSEFEVSPGGV